MTEIVVAGRFNGPPGSANGGYTCGLVAGASGLAHPEVTLRRPPPLDVPLRVDGGDVYDGETLVAAAAEAATQAAGAATGQAAGTATGEAPGGVGGAVSAGAAVPAGAPAFPGYDAARAAENGYAGLRDHPFPTCYVCGPARQDGLGLKPGPIGGPEAGPVGGAVVAGTWVPAGELAGFDGGTTVRDEFVWAALDCPGAWALMQTDESPLVLGRFAVRIERAVHVGQPHVVVGWRSAPRDGRKHYAGTALYDAAGTLLATGTATWVALQPA